MNRDSDRVVLITGASSGIGKSCAAYLSRRGFKVFGTGRQPTRCEEEYGMLEMDVTDDASIHRAVKYVIDREKRIDVLINNAGAALSGAVEDTAVEEARAQFETNFFGVIRVTGAVLPFFRRQNHGLIINISSIGGLISVPFTAFYCASKFAVEGISEALRFELKKFNIKVVLLEPGDIQSGLTRHRVRAERSRHPGPYEEQFKTTLRVIEDDENNGATIERVAEKIGEIIGKRSPKLRYVVGKPQQRLAVLLKKVLPSAWYEKIIASHYKIAPPQSP